MPAEAGPLTLQKRMEGGSSSGSSNRANMHWASNRLTPSSTVEPLSPGDRQQRYITHFFHDGVPALDVSQHTKNQLREAYSHWGGNAWIYSREMRPPHHVVAIQHESENPRKAFVESTPFKEFITQAHSIQEKYNQATASLIFGQPYSKKKKRGPLAWGYASAPDWGVVTDSYAQPLPMDASRVRHLRETLDRQRYLLIQDQSGKNIGIRLGGNGVPEFQEFLTDAAEGLRHA
jgi:hypothetical protein